VVLWHPRVGNDDRGSDRGGDVGMGEKCSECP